MLEPNSNGIYELTAGSYLCIGGNILDKRRVEQDKARCIKAAEHIKTILVVKNLNVITVESLTAGMICSTLIDIPQDGSAVYGSFVTYATDAKRQMVSVSTIDVYNHETAAQMAYGALCNTRAMTSIAVTGNAMPHRENKYNIGIVWIGIAIRGLEAIYIFTKQINIRDDGLSRMFDLWINCQSESEYAPSELTAYVADAVRINTTYHSYRFLESCIEYYENHISTSYGKIPHYSYDLNLDLRESLDMSSLLLKHSIPRRNIEM